MTLLTQFVYLQILDLLTTLAFLLRGIGEGNPVVRWAIREGPSPLGGLLLLKLAAVGLAVYCVWRARFGLLRIANIFFACVVTYNLVVLIVTSPSIQ